jgi:hypothetical protein
MTNLKTLRKTKQKRRLTFIVIKVMPCDGHNNVTGLNLLMRTQPWLFTDMFNYVSTIRKCILHSLNRNCKILEIDIFVNKNNNIDVYPLCCSVYCLIRLQIDTGIVIMEMTD